MIQTASFKALTAEDVANKLTTLAAEKKRLLILCHVNPDGDTVGSAFGLKGIYEALGGEARCVSPSPIPSYLRFLCREQDGATYTPQMEEAFDALWAVDVATPTQLGALSELAEKTSVLIDHHGTGEPFCDYYLDPKAAAAGELIEELYRILVSRGEIEEIPWVCRCLYAAISSDSGSFRFSNTTPKTLRRAASLLATVQGADDGGPDAAEISRILHDNHTLADLMAQKLGTEHLTLVQNGAIAYVCVTTEMIKKSGLTDLDFSRLIDLPRSVEGVLVAFTLKQNANAPEQYKISARSNCDIDVAAILSVFGGGGHQRAAGGSLCAPTPEEAIALFLKEVIPAVERYQASTGGQPDKGDVQDAKGI